MKLLLIRFYKKQVGFRPSTPVGCELTTCLVSDEVNDVVQGEGGGAVPACDEVGRLLFRLLVGRAGLGSDAGRVWRLLGRSLTSPATQTSSSRNLGNVGVRKDASLYLYFSYLCISQLNNPS